MNIIPERAACEFSVRAKSLEELARVRAIVERCAMAGAMAAGVEVTIAPRKGYRDLVTNLPLARAFAQHMAEMGRPAAETDERVGVLVCGVALVFVLNRPGLFGGAGAATATAGAVDGGGGGGGLGVEGARTTRAG